MILDFMLKIAPLVLFPSLGQDENGHPENDRQSRQDGMDSSITFGSTADATNRFTTLEFILKKITVRGHSVLLRGQEEG